MNFIPHVCHYGFRTPPLDRTVLGFRQSRHVLGSSYTHIFQHPRYFASEPSNTGGTCFIPLVSLKVIEVLFACHTYLVKVKKIPKKSKPKILVKTKPLLQGLCQLGEVDVLSLRGFRWKLTGLQRSQKWRLMTDRTKFSVLSSAEWQYFPGHEYLSLFLKKCYKVILCFYRKYIKLFGFWILHTIAT